MSARLSQIYQRREQEGVLTFPPTSEELPHDEYLQRCHAHHERTLHQAEVEYAPLRTSDGAEVPVLSCPEILLPSRKGGHLAGEFEDRLFHDRELLGRRTGFLRELRARFVLNLVNT